MKIWRQRNSLISADADAQLLTPKIAVNLTTQSQYLRSFSKLEVSKNYLKISLPKTVFFLAVTKQMKKQRGLILTACYR